MVLYPKNYACSGAWFECVLNALLHVCTKRNRMIGSVVVTYLIPSMFYLDNVGFRYFSSLTDMLYKGYFPIKRFKVLPLSDSTSGILVASSMRICFDFVAFIVCVYFKQLRAHDCYM